jgi:outer membrane protein assembly factor BamA
MSSKEDVMKRSITIENVIVKGLRRTKEEIVLREFADLKRSGTLEEIKDSFLHVHASLMSLDIFEAVDISLDNGSSVRWYLDIVAEFAGIHMPIYAKN